MLALIKTRYLIVGALITGFSLFQAGCAATPTPLAASQMPQRADPAAALAPQDASWTLPIGSEDELREYLRTVAAGTSPLDRFSAVTRQRFVDSLRFRGGALVGYAYPFLVAELTPAQIREVLTLFGSETPAFVLETAGRRTPEQRTRAAAISSSMTPAMLARHHAFQLAAEKFDNRAAHVAAAWTRQFAALASPAELATLSPGDLQLLFEASSATTRYTKRADYLVVLDQTLARLEALDAARPEHYAQLFRSMVLLRRFDAARTLANAHPEADIEPLPSIRSKLGAQASEPTVLRVIPNETLLLRSPVTLPRHGPQIIVVGHPSCHFSRNAVAAIEKDPLLARTFEDALWITPQDGRLDFDTMQAWNAAHPEANYAITWREREWPWIDHWATPTFYFMDDGKLAVKVVGWPKQGNRAALLSAAAKIGLLP